MDGCVWSVSQSVCQSVSQSVTLPIDGSPPRSRACLLCSLALTPPYFLLLCCVALLCVVCCCCVVVERSASLLVIDVACLPASWFPCFVCLLLVGLNTYNTPCSYTTLIASLLACLVTYLRGVRRGGSDVDNAQSSSTRTQCVEFVVDGLCPTCVHALCYAALSLKSDPTTLSNKG